MARLLYRITQEVVRASNSFSRNIFVHTIQKITCRIKPSLRSIHPVQDFHFLSYPECVPKE